MTLVLSSLEIKSPFARSEDNFQQFTIPPMSSCSILDGALHITCLEQGMTVQARLCPEGDFEDIAGKLSQKKGVTSSYHYNITVGIG